MLQLLIPFSATATLLGALLILATQDIRRARTLPSELPFVSILVPAYNAETTISETIRSIRGLDYPDNKQELLVGISGTDRTHMLCQELAIICSYRPEKTEKAIVVNQLAIQSRGDILFIVDADTVLHPDVLKKLVARFEPDVGAVTALRIARSTHSLWSILQHVEYTMTGFILTAYNRLGTTIGLHGNAMAFTRQAFFAIGGLKRVACQDFDAALTLVEQGYRVISEFTALSEVITPDLRPWFRQRFRWMHGFFLAAIKHYQVFFARPFGVCFTAIYVGFVVAFIIHLAYTAPLVSKVLLLASFLVGFKLPLTLGITFLFGYLVWSIYSRMLLVILSFLLACPYMLYPHETKGLSRISLVFAYPLLYLPLFTFTSVIGLYCAVRDQCQGRQVVSW